MRLIPQDPEQLSAFVAALVQAAKRATDPRPRRPRGAGSKGTKRDQRPAPRKPGTKGG